MFPHWSGHKTNFILSDHQGQLTSGPPQMLSGRQTEDLSNNQSGHHMSDDQTRNYSITQVQGQNLIYPNSCSNHSFIKRLEKSVTNNYEQGGKVFLNQPFLDVTDHPISAPLKNITQFIT